MWLACWWPPAASARAPGVAGAAAAASSPAARSSRCTSRSSAPAASPIRCGVILPDGPRRTPPKRRRRRAAAPRRTPTRGPRSIRGPTIRSSTTRPTRRPGATSRGTTPPGADRTRRRTRPTRARCVVTGGGTQRMRLPAIVVVVVALVGLLVAGASRPPELSPVFTSLGAPTTPFVPQLDFITSSWFCPGVPVGGAGLGGDVVVANPGDAPLSGQVTVYSDAAGAAPVVQSFQVQPRDTTTVDVGALQPGGSYATAARGDLRRRRLRRAARQGSARCRPWPRAPTRRPTQWYFADGYTKDASLEDIVRHQPVPRRGHRQLRPGHGRGQPQPERAAGLPGAGPLGERRPPRPDRARRRVGRRRRSPAPGDGWSSVGPSATPARRGPASR